MIIKTLPQDFNFQAFKFAETDKIYLLLDGARIQKIQKFIHEMDEAPEYRALYQNTYFESSLELSPCLVQLQDFNHKLFTWYLTEGANDRSGIFIISEKSITELLKHFQQFLEVKLPNLNIVLFRFYDPLVFNSIAPLYDETILSAMLEPCKAMCWQHNGLFNCLGKEDYLSEYFVNGEESYV